MKIGGGFHGMLLLSATGSRPISDGKTPCERRFGEPLKGPIIPFGSSVEYQPISPKRQVTNPSICKESAPWDIPWLCIVRGVKLKG